jgi:hypothetical protein
VLDVAGQAVGCLVAIIAMLFQYHARNSASARPRSSAYPPRWRSSQAARSAGSDRSDAARKKVIARAPRAAMARAGFRITQPLGRGLLSTGLIAYQPSSLVRERNGLVEQGGGEVELAMHGRCVGERSIAGVHLIGRK